MQSRAKKLGSQYLALVAAHATEDPFGIAHSNWKGFAGVADYADGGSLIKGVCRRCAYLEPLPFATAAILERMLGLSNSKSVK